MKESLTEVKTGNCVVLQEKKLNLAQDVASFSGTKKITSVPKCLFRMNRVRRGGFADVSPRRSVNYQDEQAAHLKET